MNCLKCKAKLSEITIQLSNNDIGIHVTIPVKCENCGEMTNITTVITRQECLGAVRENIPKKILTCLFADKCLYGRQSQQCLDGTFRECSIYKNVIKNASETNP